MTWTKSQSLALIEVSIIRNSLSVTNCSLRGVSRSWTSPFVIFYNKRSELGALLLQVTTRRRLRTRCWTRALAKMSSRVTAAAVPTSEHNSKSCPSTTRCRALTLSSTSNRSRRRSWGRALVTAPLQKKTTLLMLTTYQCRIRMTGRMQASNPRLFFTKKRQATALKQITMTVVMRCRLRSRGAIVSITSSRRRKQMIKETVLRRSQFKSTHLIVLTSPKPSTSPHKQTVMRTKN